MTLVLDHVSRDSLILGQMPVIKDAEGVVHPALLAGPTFDLPDDHKGTMSVSGAVCTHRTE